jgi:hypothetical protein
MSKPKIERGNNAKTVREIMREGCQDLLSMAIEGKPSYILTQKHPTKKFRLVAEDK